jgi:hypothetical protein
LEINMLFSASLGTVAQEQLELTEVMHFAASFGEQASHLVPLLDSGPKRFAAGSTMKIPLSFPNVM